MASSVLPACTQAVDFLKSPLFTLVCSERHLTSIHLLFARRLPLSIQKYGISHYRE